MSKFKELRLIPDWPRIRRLLAERMGMSEAAIQAMAESKDSLDQVELTMAIEEVLESLQR
jgi:acyl carrier protein